MPIIRVPVTTWQLINEKIELQDKEISDLKAKNKELQTACNKYHNDSMSLLIDRTTLLDALEETTKIHCEIVKGFPVTFKDYLPLIESNQALITKYRG